MRDKPLYSRFAPLAREDLDVNEASAREAGNELKGILCGFLNWHNDLEVAATALEGSATTSVRATEARRHLGNALDNCQNLVGSLANAEDALNFHWPES